MYDRRSFLKATTMAGLTIPFWGCGQNPSAETDANPSNLPYIDRLGMGLWTFREELKSDPEGVMKGLAELGFKYIEMFEDSRLESLPSLAREHGLEPNSTHIHNALGQGLTGEQMAKAPALMDRIAKAGIHYALYAWLAPEHRGNIDDYKALAEKLNLLGKLAQTRELQMGYHNHAFEFIPMDDTTPMETLITETDPELVTFELDLFWCKAAGIDPVSFMDKYPNRIRQLHLKDLHDGFEKTYDSIPDEAFAEVGSGILDVPAILRKAKEIGVTDVYIEQDHTKSTPMESVAKSMAYLKELSS